MTSTIQSSGDDPSAVAPPPAEQSLAGWDRYELVRELGRGGMGVVHEARDRRLGRTVALKFIRGGDPRAAMRLLQEARAQARIDHPHVCRIHEVGEAFGRAYISMQFVDGKPLGELPPSTALHDKVALMRDVALGLHEAHTLGVLHRDVKPANILVEATGDGRLHAVIMDFGLARQATDDQGLTESGAVLGTPAYMSPEQARGDHAHLDRRSDVYSLGATLYELLAGAPPFEADTKVKLLLRVLAEDPTPLRARFPSVPADLDTIVAKCLAREPQRRYDSARAVAEELDRYIRGEPILGRKASLAYRALRHARRHRALLAGAALALAALVVAGGLALRARAQARAASELGGEVAELEWFMRTAYLLPAHDLSLEETRVRARVADIAARAGGGALADYALGRGHLALHEDDAARAFLDRALDEGLDTPELHYARGVVLGRLYDRAVTAARGEGAGRLAEAEARTLVPALASLERSRGVRLESPRYLDGLIAYYRRDYATAIASAGAARAEAPWLYEATRLEADAHLARGIARRGPDRAGAVQDLDDAARLYDAALEVGRSDAGLYLGRAEVWIQRLGISLAWRGAAPPADPLARVEEWCRLAAVITPKSGAPHDKLGHALLEVGVRRSNERGDAIAAWRDAAAAAGRALAIDPGDVDGHIVLANARCDEVEAMWERGDEAVESLEDCRVYALRALALDPRHPRALNIVGRAAAWLGRSQARRGADPTAAFRDALARYAEAVRIDATVPGCRNQLEVYALWADHLVLRGQSPAALAVAVEEALAGCLRATQGAGYCREMASRFYVALARHELDAGRDGAAAQARLAALVDMPDPAPYGTTSLALFRLRAAAREGRPLGPAHEALAAAVAACLDVYRYKGTCLRLEAEGALVDGDAARARASAAGSLELDGQSAEGERLLAASDRRLGDLDGGLAACARGLSLYPDHPGLLAERAALLAARGHSAGSSPR